jgi:hypothetical protein
MTFIRSDVKAQAF